MWAAPLATVAAILAVAVYYAVTKAFGEQYLMPLEAGTPNPLPMPVLMPILTILIAGLLGGGFFGLLIRFSRKPATVFLSVAITALILSFGGPSNLPGAALQTKLLLGGMQAIAAIILTGGMLFLSHQEPKIP